MTQEQVSQFIHKNIHAVISTCSNQHEPEAALVGFGDTEQLELVFGTRNTSRKYKNLLENNKVAFVIGWGEDMCTVQYEGIAQELSGDEKQRFIDLYHKKVPSAEPYQHHPQQTYFKVTPKWVRHSDFSGEEEKIFVFTFE